jgi:hypothetical protein
MNMRLLSRAAMLLVLLCIAVPVRAAESDFKRSNPDIDKYPFARDLIMSLSYFNRVDLRFKDEEKAKTTEEQKADLALIQKIINNRTLDNTELRIARNYLTKFVSSRNVFIQNVASQAVAAYDQLLLLNNRERGLWQGLFFFKLKNGPANFSEDDFIVKQIGLALERKEAAKSLLTASVLVQKVLLSSKRCESDACQELALTEDERGKLIKKLDSFANGNLDWGLKPGQTTLEGCIAALREVLEDPLYISSDR